MLPPIWHLRTRRLHFGWTQASLARRSGVAQNTISKLETNSDADPTSQTHFKLCRALKLDPNVLVYGPDPNAPAPEPHAAGARA